MPLRPTELLIFGNAKAGTPLMQASQATGIDLPSKAWVFEDAVGKVWLASNDPRWIAQRHQSSDDHVSYPIGESINRKGLRNDLHPRV